VSNKFNNVPIYYLILSPRYWVTHQLHFVYKIILAEWEKTWTC